MMKNIRLMLLTLVFSVGFMGGCTEKKQPAEKAKEAASQAVESVVEKPAEVKEPAPVAVVEIKEKVAEKKTAPSSGAGEKAPEKSAAAGKDVEAGAAIFKSKCSPCHGAEGKGTAMAPAFKGNTWIKGAAKGDIANVIKNGREGSAKKYPNFAISMPANKQMPDSDVNALVEYIKSIN